MVGSGRSFGTGSPGPAAVAEPTSAPAPASRVAATSLRPAPAEVSNAVRYGAIIDELQRAAFAPTSQLDPATVVRLRRTLAKIDEAIEDARRALATDASDPYLNRHLIETLGLKVTLLQRAARLARAES